jgi:hypothetical protein
MPEPITVPCPVGDGTGWTCLTCDRTGRDCTCSLAEQDAMDCQSCQGTGIDDAVVSHPTKETA